MNLEVIRNLSAFKRFGYPVLLGASRKSVIGLALDLPVDKREEGTLVTTAAAVFSGCSFVRVHDVEGNKGLSGWPGLLWAPRSLNEEPEYEMQTWDQIIQKTERERAGHGPNQD